MDVCRCGWDGQGDHPCHANKYRCRKPAKSRLVLHPTCLAGVQMKMGAYETFACDECWAEVGRESEVHARFLEIVDRIQGIDRVPGTDSRVGGVSYDDLAGVWRITVDGEHRALYSAIERVGAVTVPALAGLGYSDAYAAVDAIHEVVVGLAAHRS